MRAFRRYTHDRGDGYFGYMQMTSGCANYSRYILGRLVESLENPYNAPEVESSGWTRLSTAVVESPALSSDDVERLRSAELTDDDRTRLVVDLAERLMKSDNFLQDTPIDLLQAMLLLQCDSPAVRQRVMKYLRGEELHRIDRDKLAGIASKHEDNGPQQLIEWIGRLMWDVHQASLVLCLDQLEDSIDAESAKKSFSSLMQSVRSISENIPRSIVVLSCISDYYDALRQHLPMSLQDRIEHNPEPIALPARRSPDEVADLVQTHLGYLYDHFDIDEDGDDPTFPLNIHEIRSKVFQRTRDLMNFFREHRQRCILAGEVLPLDESERPAAIPSPPDLVPIEQLWNDYRDKPVEISDAAEERAQLFARAVQLLEREFGAAAGLSAQSTGRGVQIELSNGNGETDLLYAEVCDKSAQGGALARQILELEKAARSHVGSVQPLAIRSTEFPSSPTTKVAQQLGAFVKAGGRKVVVSDADWRTMQALINFVDEQGDHGDLPAWLQEARPLGHLRSMRLALDLDNRPTAGAAPAKAPSNYVTAPAAISEVAAQPPASPKPNEVVCIGRQRSHAADEVLVPIKELKRHAAFLGSTGSGKTTAAMNILEQLLLDGIPVVLVDRKGDLCRYADPGVWSEPATSSDILQRRERLKREVETVVYTPGNLNGRPMRLPVLPDGVHEMKSDERGDLARLAAHSLASMLNYPAKGKGQHKRAVLTAALALLAEQSREAVCLREVRDFIGNQDPSLINAMNTLDVALLRGVSQDLDAMLLNQARLFSSTGASLSADELLGRNRQSEKTRMSVVCAKFLGGLADVQFWVAQMLIEFERWASKNPSNDLQAVLMLDEADIYLPAASKPATKEPIESLLKRGRSAGLGVFLASQSPGDFDYKCRDNINSWFLGRIAEENAIKKMKPLLSDYRRDVSADLSGQTIGQFLVARAGEVTAVTSRPSAVQTRQLAEDEILQLARDAHQQL
jgi:hypothetical protein